MWIKICGNTSLADAQHAASVGASALGFIFAPSPRRVTVDQVRAITPHLPRNVERYGVFVDASFDEIVSAVEQAGLSGIQLHRTTDTTLAQRLHDYFHTNPGPFPVRIVAVVHFQEAFDRQIAELIPQASALDALLIDSRTANAFGGTGTRYDWHSARKSFRELSPKIRLIAAGGLDPDSVGQAIHLMQPWGVDVATGVEAAPGRKDVTRVAAFIRNARAAFASVEAASGQSAKDAR